MSIQQDTQQGIAYLTWNTYNISSVWVIIITPAGFLQILGLDQKTKKWFLNWKAPEKPCDIYGICRPFRVCNKKHSRICECIKGFIPNSNEEWSKGNWISGCVRQTELFCDKNASNLVHVRTKKDWFWKISGVKLPDRIEYLNKDAPGCREWCLNNCPLLGLCIYWAWVYDPKKGVQLDWAKRFNIIQGIAQGLVYVHRDSCLRVIHRDLKGSNILLDDQMNPKISDFGLARTFEIT
ncbi:hypothetical protein LguiA_015064 [Lonicera macranthoides]